VAVKDNFEVAMAEDKTSPHNDMWLVACHAFETLEDVIGHEQNPEFATRWW
jgi:hypothetical protein